MPGLQAERSAITDSTRRGTPMSTTITTSDHPAAATDHRRAAGVFRSSPRSTPAGPSLSLSIAGVGKRYGRDLWGLRDL